MSEKFSGRRRMSVESLEGRWLMAGDVTATVINGNLFIVGDDLDNRISITNGANADEVVIEGFDDGGGNPTNVGGAPNGSVTKTGVTGNIVVTMRGGNDFVGAHDLDAQRNLAITLDDGNDAVWLGAAAVNSSGVVFPQLAAALATFPAGLVSAGPVTVARSLILNGGTGNDNVSQSETSVAQQEVINLGLGGDHVFMGLAAAGNLSTNNTAKDMVVNLGRGADSVAGYQLDIQRALAINDLGGVTDIDLHTIAVNHAAILTTGPGSDDIAIKNMHALNVAILTGHSPDTVKIEDSTFKRLEVLLFGGNDTLEIGNTTVSTQGFLDGGAGTGDTYDQLTPNTFTNVKKVRFEINT